MSDLVYQYTSKKCTGWTNPSSNLYGPYIDNLSGFQSPAGSTTLVSINGKNFYSYSTVAFGTYNPTVYFINSNILQFYVPSTLNSGTYPVQVFNGSVPSNSVEYTIDNASGYWLLNPNGSITNTNINVISSDTITDRVSIVNVNSLSRGAPVIIQFDEVIIPYIYIVPYNVNWIICDNNAGGIPVFQIDLPTGIDSIGREIMIKTVSNSFIKSTRSNIVGLTDVINSSDNILGNDSGDPQQPAGPGSWVTLVNNDTLWYIMQGYTFPPVTTTTS